MAGMWRKAFEFFASLKLALLLLAVLIVASAVGTWYESKLNADVAREYVYNAWWFNSWMVVLVINLFCAAAIRYPWKPYQTGFVITHAGIIILLIGGMIDRRWGIEGYIELNRGEAAMREMSLHEQEFMVYAPGAKAPTVTNLRVKAFVNDIRTSALLDKEDVSDWDGLWNAIAADGPMTAPSPARRVWKYLPDFLKKELKATPGGPAPVAQRGSLLDALNTALNTRDFYAEQDFADAEFSAEAQALLAEPRASLSTRELHRLNRLVLAAGFDGLIRPGRVAVRPVPLESPDPSVAIRIVDIQPAKYQVERLVADPKGFAAAKLVIESERMGRHEVFLALGEERNLGPAVVGFERGLPPAAAGGPRTSEAEDPPGKKVPRRELHYTFARSDDMARVIAGSPTGAKASAKLDEKTGVPMLKLELEGKQYEFAALDCLGKDVALVGLKDWTLRVTGYYPNFKLDGMKPISDGDRPENPTIVFELVGPLVDEEDAGHGHAHGGPRHGHDAHGPKAAGGFGDPNLNNLKVYLGDDGKLRFVANSRAAGQTRGDVELHKAVNIGWAGGTASFKVEQFEARALPAFAWSPLDDLAASAETHRLAVKVELSADGKTQRVWLGPRVGADATSAIVPVAGGEYKLAFADRRAPLPFGVELLKFRAPAQEGLEGSGQFMAFESVLAFEGQYDTVRLKDDAALMRFEQVKARNGILTGGIVDVDERRVLVAIGGQEVAIPRPEVASFERNSHKIHMNHPTTFPITWYGPWLGTSYKFSQSSHDPNRPDFSVVQVLRDPGWMPKWVGSLLISFGIFTMFYLKPYFRRTAAPAPAATAGQNRDAPESAVKGT